MHKASFTSSSLPHVRAITRPNDTRAYVVLVKSARWIRLTAIGTVVALAVLTLSACCTFTTGGAQQHGCCTKGRCASMSAAAPIVALGQAKHRLPPVGFATGHRAVAANEASPSGILGEASVGPRRFPIVTIQLRI